MNKEQKELIWTDIKDSFYDFFLSFMFFIRCLTLFLIALILLPYRITKALLKRS